MQQHGADFLDHFAHQVELSDDLAERLDRRQRRAFAAVDGDLWRRLSAADRPLVFRLRQRDLFGGERRQARGLRFRRRQLVDDQTALDEERILSHR